MDEAERGHYLLSIFLIVSKLFSYRICNLKKMFWLYQEFNIIANFVIRQKDYYEQETDVYFRIPG